jgi:urea transport system permease protein
MFKRRVGGVYFSIITQAVALILSILIVGQQGYTGGVNGMTDLRTMLGWDIRSDSAKYILYFVNGLLLFGAIFLSKYIMSSKFGMLLLAMRDKEERVRFSGYDVSNFKIFIFCFAAMLSAVGGAMFTLQVGFMSPSFVGIVPSIEMVIFCAVGGRASLVGAVYGTLLVNYGKTVFSETYPEMWLFLMGGLFIAVVMFFPSGLAGIWDKYATKYGWFKDKAPATKKPEVSTSKVEAQAVLTETQTETTLATESTDVAGKKTTRKKAGAKEENAPAIEGNKLRGAEA